MNVQLLAHTQLSDKFYRSLDHGIYDVFLGRCDGNHLDDYEATDAQSVALSAVRTRYSVNKQSEIVAEEGAKYFGNSTSDGGEGTDTDTD